MLHLLRYIIYSWNYPTYLIWNIGTTYRHMERKKFNNKAETLTIWLQSESSNIQTKKDSIESIERDIKNLEDKLDLLRQRIQLLPEWEQRTKTEEEYAQTKEEIEILTIRHSLLSSK